MSAYLSRFVKNSHHDFSCRRDIEKSFRSPSGWDRLVRDAGAAGIRGDDCDVLYRDCDIPVTRKIRKISSNVSIGSKERDKLNSIR